MTLIAESITKYQSSNQSSNQSRNFSLLANSNFEHIDKLFLLNEWSRIDNEVNIVSYSKCGHETEYFQVNLDDNLIYVTIPLKDVPYHYTTKFTDFMEACYYITIRFNEFRLM